VFEPFRRLEPSRNRSTGGVGLGLAIARNLARGHGGDITLDSAAPAGARFIFSLPLR
jgi:signal transduction histidine kinase